MENSSIQENLRIFKHQNSVYNVNIKSIIQNPSNQNEITQIFTFDPKQTHENIYVYTFTDNNNNQLFLNQYDLQNKSLNQYYQLDNHQLSPQDSDLNFNQKANNYQNNFINFIDNMQQVTEDVQAENQVSQNNLNYQIQNKNLQNVTSLTRIHGIETTINSQQNIKNSSQNSNLEKNFKNTQQKLKQTYAQNQNQQKNKNKNSFKKSNQKIDKNIYNDNIISNNQDQYMKFLDQNKIQSNSNLIKDQINSNSQFFNEQNIQLYDLNDYYVNDNLSQIYQNITANQVRNNNGQFGIIPFSICDQKCILGKQTCFKFRIISNKQDGIYLGICDKNTLYLDKYCKTGHNWAQNEDKHGVYMIDTGLKSLGKSKSYNDFDPYFNDSDQVPFEFYGEEDVEIGVQVDLIENIIYFRKINGRKSGFEYAMPINKMNRSWLYPCVAMYNSYSIVQIFPYQW